MARRARKGVESAQIIIIVVVVIALAAAAYFVTNRSKDPFAGLNPLPVGEYMNNANSLSGNVYRLSGTVSVKERYTENSGQMIYVEVQTPTGPLDIPVIVPVELYGTNIDRGDAIESKVEVRTRGIIEMQEIR
ncbi:MAG: hypothetical protein ACI8XO_005022 [Verrucomicrobiales bacterium]|jgi:hypothetical protein